ncbi:MAG: ArsC family reductase [Gammaproteobacteria bacterium]|nr:ArsC family reductase [Gammaproteobacteria bacterium]
MIIYGIKNCDTVKKACRWLDANGIAFEFHDFRRDGLDENIITTWLQTVTWHDLLNRKSTTWRQVDPAQRNALNADSAIQLMLTSPTIIKRPVLVNGDKMIIGFNEQNYMALLK